MANKYRIGDIAYIIVSKRLVQEVMIINKSGDFCTVRLAEGGGALKLRESKLFLTKAEAKKTMPWDGVRKWHPC